MSFLTDYELELIQEQGEADKIQPSEFEDFVQKMITRQTHLSFSSIRNFIPITGGTPYGFMKYKLRKFEATKAMTLGDAIDVLILTPEEKGRFAIIPDDAALNSLAGIDAYAQWLGKMVPDFDPDSIKGLKIPGQKLIIQAALDTLSKTKTIISASDFAQAEFISRRVLANEYVQEFTKHLNKDSVQVPVDFNAFGWKWRGKMDAYINKPFKWNYKKHGYDYPNGCVIDMKLMVDASHNAAVRTIRNEFYTGQGAIYTKGTGLNVPFLNICYDRQGGVSIIEHSERTTEGAWKDIEFYMGELNSLVSISEIMPSKWFDSHTYWVSSQDGVYQMQ